MGPIRNGTNLNFCERNRWSLQNLPRFRRFSACFLLLPLKLLFTSAQNSASSVNQPIVAATIGRTNIRFFDASLPDEETLMVEEELVARAWTRRRRQRRQAEAVAANPTTNFLQQLMPENLPSDHPFHVDLRKLFGAPADEIIDDSAMYREDRFEGDIVNPGLSASLIKSWHASASKCKQAENSSSLAKLLSRNNGDNNETTTPAMDVHPGSLLQRNAVRHPFMKWPDGRIPFTVSRKYNGFGRDRIAEALDEYRKRTCIRWVPKTPADQDYVHILPDDGCYSLVGRAGGKQPVSLGDGCIVKGIIIHELMHAVGFFHEQSRTDRDDYVLIHWENVQNGLQDQFDKYPLSMLDFLGTSYDYASIMHYGPTAFSKNGLPTIEPRQRGQRIGQRIDLSPVDLFKVNKLYQCPNTPQNPQFAHPAPLPHTQPPLLATTLVPPATASPPTAAGGVAPVTTINAAGTLLSVTSTASGGPQPAECADRRPDCISLATNGLCTAFYSADYMALNCPRTCQKCTNVDNGQGPTTTKPSLMECFDRETWCARWAFFGLCQLSVTVGHMRQNCPVTCGFCQQSS